MACKLTYSINEFKQSKQHTAIFPIKYNKELPLDKDETHDVHRPLNNQAFA